MNRSKLGSFVRRAEDAPTLPGAYVLIVELAESIQITLPRKPKTTLQAGHYLYCGSAKGSGGIRARLSRHMRPGKVIHWHVDLLTAPGQVTGAWTFPGCDECELVRDLSHLPAPIRGFGSTDCPRCWSHLLSWPRPARNNQCRGGVNLRYFEMRERAVEREVRFEKAGGGEINVRIDDGKNPWISDFIGQSL
jgi:Uri superfamily endonuclease